ncbi:MAG: hypothetical protein D6812_11655 [Deltaproteobacteria bacterium]|nr:MAG: hypothetical protein D6812_11655 [Deltaproteobacteria bacterium]
MTRAWDDQEDPSVRSPGTDEERPERGDEAGGKTETGGRMQRSCGKRALQRVEATGAERTMAGARAVVEAMERLFHEVLVSVGHSPRKEVPSGLTIDYVTGMTPESLLERIEREAKVYLARHDAFQVGRVYCYHCGAALCEHTHPAAPGEVFAGYRSTGRPRWEEFFSYMLALNDDRVDRLFEENPPILSRLVGRKRLVAEQLLPFGKSSMTYLILGQVVAGYLYAAGERQALTLQIIETKERRLRVQLIATEQLRDALAEAVEGKHTPLLRVYDALKDVERRVETINLSWHAARSRAERNELKERVFATLRHFATSVERKGRQRQRRTSHAEERGRQKRPVHMAFEDCLHATSEDFFRDTDKGSIVVLGKRGRVHVYTEGGRHVTSFLLERDQLERRRRRRRYEPLTSDEIDRFRTCWRRGMKR